MTVGLMTAGGDCPGLNAAIRAVVTRLNAAGMPVLGIRDGWKGLIEGDCQPITRDDVRGILTRGGTILGTSRVDPYLHGEGYASVKPTLDKWGLERLIVIGGDGSLTAASRLNDEGLPVVGIPKTIDNDIRGTEVTFGFNTAVQIVTDAIDRLTTTAESHNRVLVVEVMGRTAGWIAAYAGIAGGAEAILVPEVPYDIENVASRLRTRHRSGADYSIIVVAEGALAPGGQVWEAGVDAYGFSRLGGVATVVAEELERLTSFETRSMILGYLQRGGSPTAYDRVLATRLGVKAAELTLAGESGVMVGLQADDIVAVDLSLVAEGPRNLDVARYEVASWFWPDL